MTSQSGGAESAVILTPPHPAARAPSRAEIERGIVRGRTLQGEAVRAGFRRLARLLVGRASLGGTRAPAGLPARRHSCC